MACNLDLNSGALAATAAHADENRADDRGGRDQAGVERLHRHRRCESDLTSRDDDGGYFVRPPRSVRCEQCETQEPDSGAV